MTKGSTSGGIQNIRHCTARCSWPTRARFAYGPVREYLMTAWCLVMGTTVLQVRVSFVLLNLIGLAALLGVGWKLIPDADVWLHAWYALGLLLYTPLWTMLVYKTEVRSGGPIPRAPAGPSSPSEEPSRPFATSTAPSDPRALAPHRRLGGRDAAVGALQPGAGTLCAGRCARRRRGAPSPHPSRRLEASRVRRRSGNRGLCGRLRRRVAPLAPCLRDPRTRAPLLEHLRRRDGPWRERGLGCVSVSDSTPTLRRRSTG